MPDYKKEIRNEMFTDQEMWMERPGSNLNCLILIVASTQLSSVDSVSVLPTHLHRIVWVAVAQSVQWLTTGWMTEGLKFEVRWGQAFSFLHIAQTGSGVHSTSYPMGKGKGALSPGVKRPGRVADHSLPTSAEVKKTRVLCIHSLICLHGVVFS
jgi:hypothetical protein